MSETAIIEPGAGPPVRHERTDIEAKGVIVFVAALGVALIVIAVLLRFFFFGVLGHEEQAKKTQYPLAYGARDKLPPSPRLEGIGLAGPEHDIGRLRPSGAHLQTDREDQVLQKGGTIPGEDGFARIPIAEAMRRVIASGELRVRQRAPVGRRDGYLHEPDVTNSGRAPRGGQPANAKGTDK